MASPLPISTDADHIATITIEPNQGPMVILDKPLIERLDATLDAVKAKNPAGVILASGSPRVFIAGADLKSIAAMSHAELEAYLRFGQVVFGKLCAMPCPTVAAINGAALGGGLELAMHCDGLVASPPAPGKDGTRKPYPIGLPEAGLSICPGWGGTNLLPARMDPEEAIKRTCQGKPLTLDEAVQMGMLDALAPSAESLIDAAKAWLRQNSGLAGKRRDGQPLKWIGRDGIRNGVQGAFVMLKQEEFTFKDPAKSCMEAVRQGLEHGWEAALLVERRELNRLRNEPAGKGAIDAFLNKAK